MFARGFDRSERVGVAAEDEEDLDAELDKRLVQREVGHFLPQDQRQRPIEELESDLGLRLVQGVGGEAVQHPRGVAEEGFRIDELEERFAEDRVLIREPAVADDAVHLPRHLVRDLRRDFHHAGRL